MLFRSGSELAPGWQRQRGCLTCGCIWVPAVDCPVAAPQAREQTSKPLYCLHPPADSSARPGTVMPVLLLCPLLTEATPALCRRPSYPCLDPQSPEHRAGSGSNPAPLWWHPDIFSASPGPIPDSGTAGPAASWSPSSGPEVWSDDGPRE